MNSTKLSSEVSKFWIFFVRGHLGRLRKPFNLSFKFIALFIHGSINVNNIIVLHNKNHHVFSVVSKRKLLQTLTPWTKVWIGRSQDVLNVFQTPYVRLIYVLYPGETVFWYNALTSNEYYQQQLTMF